MKHRTLLFEEKIYHQHKFVVEYETEDQFEAEFDEIESDIACCNTFDDIYSLIREHFKLVEIDEDYSTDSDGIEYEDDYECGCEYQRYGD